MISVFSLFFRILLCLAGAFVQMSALAGNEEYSPANSPAMLRASSIVMLDQQSDTLRQDDGRPTFAFRFPDAYGDDWRNQRFRPPRSCLLVGAMFAFPTRGFALWSTGDPDLLVRVWPMGEDSLPVVGGEWLTDTTQFNAFAANIFPLDSVWRGGPSQFVIVDLSNYAIALQSGQWFHVGYSALRDSDDDSLAILSDDGSPPTSFASEWYRGRFVTLREGWGGVNLFIRAIVDYGTGDLRILNPRGVSESLALGPVYPNPFNAMTTLVFSVPRLDRVTLGLYDVLGRERARILDEVLAPGNHVALLDAKNLPAGTYFVHLRGRSGSRTLKVILVP